MAGKEDPMAYGHYAGQGESARGGGEGERSLLGSTFNMLRDKYNAHSQHQSQQQYNPQGGYPGQTSSQGYQQAFPQSQQPYSGAPPTADPVHGQNPQYYGTPQQQQHNKPDLVSGLLGKIQGYGSEVAQKLGSSIDPQAYAQYGAQGAQGNANNRFGSFAPERNYNDAKWYVDGCGYMWAVSRALETARESIWILDWWLSPELYLRRPPAKNEQYRLDRMLQAAAQRGVKVNIIVYKEVTQALTLSSSHTKHHLENLHPNISVFRHPDHLPDRQTLQNSVISSFQNLSLDAGGIAKMSGDALKGLYGMHDDVILYWAHHEKLCLIDGKTAFMGGLDLCFGRWDTYQHATADVHPTDLKDIVFPGQDYNNARMFDFHDVVHWENNQLDRKESARMGWSDVAVSLHGPAVEDLRKHFVDRWNFIYDEKYGVRHDQRYSKLVLYARPLSSLGGLQPGSSGYVPQPTNQPAAAPGSAATGGYPPSSQASYPPSSAAQPHQQVGTYGQQSTQQYPPATTQASYPPTPAAPAHEHQASAYGQQSSQQYPPPPPGPPPAQTQHSAQQPQWSATATPPHAASASPVSQSQSPQPPQQAPYFPPPPSQGGAQHSETRGFDGYSQGSERAFGQGQSFRGLRDEVSGFGKVLRGQLAGQVHQYQDRYFSGQPGRDQRGNTLCQIIRSCTKWSNGGMTEHSIADAYATIIKESEHFVYIENQFFITATSDAQKPVRNKIGAAIVERILRAARAGQKYKVIIVIPSVPGFAGDLREDASLGTRAIMEFQYNSINRGGHSIMECIAREGYNPMDYIRFYNLRNYDRINASAEMRRVEQQSGVNYEDARAQYDHTTAGSGPTAFDTTTPYQQYQQAAHQVAYTQSPGSGRWNSVSSCYMLGGEDIRNVPWEHPGDVSEIDAFVSEELYVHSKVMIADDRTVIIGSANLNDRSQLGEHDSEIAVVIQDPTPVESTMNGQPWPVSRFAATLRRQLCRKHLGLLPPQDFQRPDANFEPVGIPNEYDMNAPENHVVADPLSDTFQSLWNSRARQNTEVFRKVFHVVPDDSVRNWGDYKEFYEYYFRAPNPSQPEKDTGVQPPPRYRWGHVIKDEFPGGVAEVKEQLSKVKGTLVEMPLMFLIEEDIAKEGLSLNSLTEEIYT